MVVTNGIAPQRGPGLEGDERCAEKPTTAAAVRHDAAYMAGVLNVHDCTKRGYLISPILTQLKPRLNWYKLSTGEKGVTSTGSHGIMANGRQFRINEIVIGNVISTNIGSFVKEDDIVRYIENCEK